MQTSDNSYDYLGNFEYVRANVYSKYYLLSLELYIIGDTGKQ